MGESKTGGGGRRAGAGDLLVELLVNVLEHDSDVAALLHMHTAHTHTHTHGGPRPAHPIPSHPPLIGIGRENRQRQLQVLASATQISRKRSESSRCETIQAQDR
jgi:hypothetical protein